MVRVQGSVSDTMAERTQFGVVLILLAAVNASVAVGQFALGVALAVFLGRWWVGGVRPPRLGVEFASLALAVWALTMIPLSEEPVRSVVSYRRFYLFTAMWVVAQVVVGERRRQWAACALLGGAVAVAVAGTGWMWTEHGTLFVTRAVFVSNAMTSAALLMIAAVVGVAFVVVSRGWRQWLVGAAVVVVILGLLQTMTRSALAGLLVGSAVVAVVACPRRGWWWVVAGAAAVVLVLTTGEHFVPERLWQRIAPETLIEGRNAQARFDMWRAGLRMIAEHPWTGVGDVSLGELSEPYYDPEPQRLHGHMHNNLVQVAVIWGLPGLAFFLALFAAQLWAPWSRWRSAQRVGLVWASGWSLGALGAVVAFFVAGFTEWYFGDAEPLLMVMAIIGLGAAPLDGDERT
ncbi:MAG TPA: O-antigen ligase family protein [Candidatus Krumholzibacteria bacterium]|nr:O-antigen ligase family protein [Candidatus Krumholzibacteria bacterium]